MSAAFDRYKNTLVLCLAKYQFIEEGLRFCLIRCHATTKFRLEGFLPYEVPLQAIEDAALGRLVDWYRAYTKNSDLIRDLRAIKSVRDKVAHTGLTLTVEQQIDDAFLRQKTRELEEALAKAEACFVALMGEMQSVDKAVNRAYEQLRADLAAQGSQAEIPEPFTDQADDSPQTEA